MKRFILPLAVVLVLAGAGIYLQRHMSPHARLVASWLPGDTILFEDIPDIRRSAERWPETALAQIIDEPEVQTLLARPLASAPQRKNIETRMDQARRIDPAHFLLAVTSVSGTGAPSVIAGLDFLGSKQDLDNAVGDLRKWVQGTWPAGTSDVEKYGMGDIETFTTPAFSAGLAYRGQWLFLSTDVTLLKATLDRFEGQRDPNNLAESPAFKNCLQHLPPAADNLFFLRPVLLSDQASSLALMLNPMADTHGMEGLKKIDAVGLAFKMDGELMRDAAYVVTSTPGEDTPLARDSLKLSTPDTIVAVSSRLQSMGDAQMPDPKTDPSGMLQLLASYLKTFSDQGLGAQQFGKAFGPESGFLLDWPTGAMIPAPLVMMDVRDGVLAHKFLDTLTTLPLAAGVAFSRQDAGGISFYSLPPTGIGIFPLQVTMGLTGKCVIAGLNMDAIKQGAERWDGAGTGLAGTAPYKKAAALVQEPTASFTYLDIRAVFSRLYGLFKGAAAFGLIPHLSDYVDIAKLPAPETITRHLSPIVASSAVRDGGMLMESAGPVTTTEAGMFGGVLVGAAAVPYIEAQIKGQSVSFSGFSGFKPKGASPMPNPIARPLTPRGSINPGPPAAPAATPVPAASASGSGGAQ